METTRDTFAQAIDGSAGTVIFGNGINAISGAINHRAGSDYITIEQPAPNDDVVVVPLASIVYFRFEQE